MTDIEMTKLAAEAMGFKPEFDSENTAVYCNRHTGRGFQGKEARYGGFRYDPLHDDAQCFGLVKRFELRLWKDPYMDGSPLWAACRYGAKSELEIYRDTDINRAIVVCVAKMQSRGEGR